MYTLTATRDRRAFRFQNDLQTLITQAGEYDTATITDVDGAEVYTLAFTPFMIIPQAS